MAPANDEPTIVCDFNEACRGREAAGIWETWALQAASREPGAPATCCISIRPSEIIARDTP